MLGEGWVEARWTIWGAGLGLVRGCEMDRGLTSAGLGLGSEMIVFVLTSGEGRQMERQ